MRNLRKILALVLALAMTMSLLAINAAATDVGPKQTDATGAIVTATDNAGANPVAPMSTSYPFSAGKDEKYITVINKPTGINHDVLIEVLRFAPSRYQMDILMYGRSGLIFREEDCLGTSSSSRTFWCGSDITSVMIRIVPRNTLFPAVAMEFGVIVTY